MADAQAQTSQPLAAVYLINGDDELKRETTLRRLRARIAASGDLLLNQDVFAAESLSSPDQLLDALNTPPFGGELRLVLVPNAEKLPREVSEALVGYLARPTPTSVLALSANKLAANTRLYKAVLAHGKGSLIDVSSVKRSELPQHLRDTARNHGITLDYEAAQSLIGRIGTSMEALNNELRRLSVWAHAAGRTALGAADIVEQVPSLVEPKPWELADALCQRNLALCLRMYSQMHSATPTGAFSFCVGRLREVLTIVSLRARGLSSGRIAERLKRQEWQLRSSFAAARRFEERELGALLRDASRHEAAMKSGADAEQVFLLWLVEVCRG